MTTGALILINYHLQMGFDGRIVWVETIFCALVVLVISLIVRSLWGCINSIAARKTVRAINPAEIPSRFLFNWGDTIKSVDGFSDFAQKTRNLSLDMILGNALSELWTDILQHSQRHRHLRSAIGTFRYCVVSLLALAIFVFVNGFR